jgi:hypothetical protein
MHTLRCWVVASDVQPGIGAFITNQNLIDQNRRRPEAP